MSVYNWGLMDHTTNHFIYRFLTATEAEAAAFLAALKNSAHYRGHTLELIRGSEVKE